jgi:hypothetical protein
MCLYSTVCKMVTLFSVGDTVRNGPGLSELRTTNHVLYTIHQTYAQALDYVDLRWRMRHSAYVNEIIIDIPF